MIRLSCYRSFGSALLVGLTILGAALGRQGRSAEATAPTQQAQDVFRVGQVQGGLVVHVGFSDGQLTAALRRNDRYIVHGLTTDPRQVADARQRYGQAGAYGQVSFDTFDGIRLPYVDNGVNLLVAEDLGDVPLEEVMRVLAPGGVVCVEKDGVWTRTVKPWPETIDQWTHYLHDASNNAVAQDDEVGPPGHVQWVGGPTYLRHHDHLSGLSALVSARGRLFYIIDLGPRWSVQMPPQWTLVARDAFSGVRLWQQPIKKWHAHLWSLKKGPADLMRRLVAVDDTVYVTLGVGQGVTALDAATGSTLRTYEGTAGAEELILSNGVLLVLANPRLDAYRELPRDSVINTRRASVRWNWDERPRRLLAIEPATGRQLWAQESVVVPNSLGAADGRVYFHDGEKVLCLRADCGERVWASPPIARWKPMHVLFGPSLVIYDDVVLFAGGENMDPLRGGEDTMTALPAATGEVLWTAPHPASGYSSAKDLLVIDGVVWCGQTTNRSSSGVFKGRDFRTGEVLHEFPPDDWQPHMSHHRCYRAKATSNFILTSRTGIEFVDFRQQHWTPHHWVRGSCNYGILPCNGLVYAPPHSCACYLLAKLSGFHALAPVRRAESRERRAESGKRRAESQERRAESGRRKAESGERSVESGERRADGEELGVEERCRLEKGAAYGDRLQLPALGPPLSSIDSPLSPAWPTYRQNPARSGFTPVAVPADLGRHWQTELGGRLSCPVVAGGRVFVASIDRHAVHAVDAERGTVLWTFTAGARIDSPPTVWKGRVLFGSADGYVYCLRADGGELIWRYRAAPVDQRLLAYEQLEAVWPVHGSVLVYEGVVFCVAGRSMWLDGGMRLVRLDAQSGRLLSETVLDDKLPGTGNNLQTDLRWPNLPVALSDVLSCDGRHVYLRSQPFGLDGKRPEVITPRNHEVQQGETAHLFSPTGFLDDSWWHRTYWMYGRSYMSGAAGWHLASYQAPTGRILVFDDSSVYGFGRAPQRYRGTALTYHLFSCDKQPRILGQATSPPKIRRSPYTQGDLRPTRIEYHWSNSVPLLVRAMVGTDQTLYVAGPPDQADEREVYLLHSSPEVQRKMAEQVAAFAGRRGGLIMAVSKADGRKRTAFHLDSIPVFDGMAAAGGRLFLATVDGKLLCLGSGAEAPLRPAPDVESSALTDTSAVPRTRSHPDFQKIVDVWITPCQLGYRLQARPNETGWALKELPAPVTRGGEFRVKIRPRPGAPAGTGGNGFLAFGDGPDDSQLIRCGFRIGAGNLSIIQRKPAGGTIPSVPVTVTANELAELKVTVDLARPEILT